jgi:hypothetical protein
MSGSQTLISASSADFSLCCFGRNVLPVVGSLPTCLSWPPGSIHPWTQWPYGVLL